MNLLPVKHKPNVVSKSRLPRPPSRLNDGGTVAEVWGSVKVQACFSPLWALGAFPCNGWDMG